MHDKKDKPPAVPYLCVNSYGQTTWIDLDDASNALIGSGGHCKVQISGNDVRSLHCIVAMKDGCLEVRDWNTGCTFVNGQAISEPINLQEGDCLKIGDHEITAVLTEAGAQKLMEAEAKAEDVAPVEAPVSTSDSVVAVERKSAEVGAAEPVVKDKLDIVPKHREPELTIPVVAEEAPVVESEVENALSPASKPVLEVEREVAQEAAPEFSADPKVDAEPAASAEPKASVQPVVETESQVVTAQNDEPELEVQTQVESSVEIKTTPQPATVPAEFVYDIDADFEGELGDSSFGFAVPGFADDLVSSDELQDLRMENEQLRFELAELSKRRVGSSGSSDVLNREQTVKLVSRLEDMIGELKRSDARSLELEELLRAADQATEDEQEERKQMAKWVSELESRVTQRESESDGEIQTLKKLLNEARQSQQKSNDSLKSVIAARAGDGEVVPSELVEGLRKQIESLQSQLHSSEEECSALRNQLESRNAPATEDDLNRAKQELAETQLEASRERAEVSRQRAELQRLKAELEDRLTAPREANVADTRIRAMREHLKELHDKEMEAKANQTGVVANGRGALANRIASLLQRVTGE